MPSSGKLGIGLPLRLGVIAGTSSYGFGQSQADIKATSYGLGQAKADIKATVSAVSQAQADIKVTSFVSAQSQADIKVLTVKSAQAQADIKATSFGFGQAKADVKTTLFGSAQAQAQIGAISLGFAQANVDIKAVTFASAQAQSDIKAVIFGYSQAQADVKAVSSAVGQAQAQIRVVVFGFAQANADIKAVTFNSAQAQTDIKATSYGVGQAQTDVKAIAFAYGQSNADIQATSFGFGQAQGILSVFATASAQAQAIIRSPFIYVDRFNRVVAVGLGTNDTTTYVSTGPDEASVDGSVAISEGVAQYTNFPVSPFGTVKFDFYVPADTSDTGVGYDYVGTTLSLDDVGSYIDYLIQLFSNGDGTWLGALNDITTTFTPDASTWYSIKTEKTPTDISIKIWKRSDPEPSSWDATGAVAVNGFGVSNLLVIAGTPTNPAQLDNLSAMDLLGQGYGQAQAKITASSYAHGQAQALIGQSLQTGQAQAKLNAFGYPQFGQAQAFTIAKLNQLVFPHYTFPGYDPSAGIFGSGLNVITPEFYVPPNITIDVHITQAITGSIEPVAALFLLDLRTATGDAVNPYDGSVGVYTLTTPNDGLTKAYVLLVLFSPPNYEAGLTGEGYVVTYTKTTWLGLGQAQANITTFTQGGFAQAQARITGVGRGFGQAKAKLIRVDIAAVGHVQTFVIYKQSPNAQAQTRVTGRGYGFAAVQADIFNQSRAFGQANTDIRKTQTSSAQAQTFIARRFSGLAQAQANINASTSGGSGGNPQPFGPPEYKVIYNGQQLPGYPQSEEIITEKVLDDFNSFDWDGSLTQQSNLVNPSLKMNFLIYSNSYKHAKNLYKEATAILLSKKEGFAKLYVDYSDRYRLAKVKAISYSAQADKNLVTLTYSVEFECLPYIISSTQTTLSGATGIVTTTGRTLANGTWTPTVVTLTGLNVTVSGYTSTEFTGYISVDGYVPGLVLDTENQTAFIGTNSAVDKLLSKDFSLYVGSGPTSFEVSGAEMITITYYDRWV